MLDQGCVKQGISYTPGGERGILREQLRACGKNEVIIHGSTLIEIGLVNKI